MCYVTVYSCLFCCVSDITGRNFCTMLMYRFHRQTDRQTDIDIVKMKCAGIAQYVFWKCYGAGARILNSQQRKESFLFSSRLVISSGVIHPPHQCGMGAVFLAVNWPELEGNSSAPLPSSRKCGIELPLRRIIF